MSAPYDMSDQMERTRALFAAILGELHPVIREARDQKRNPIDVAEVISNAVGNALGMVIGTLPEPHRGEVLARFIAGLPTFVAAWQGDAPKGGVQ
ncbi:molybdopterin-biosynthesis enzyme MoeA-like protein [Novosphingobium sp. SG751A]|uniref:hypothetical protein n=1 Tax=Novosphingobium sp. SG751A TaxID=2587000 RepID=UPI001554001D|nr:hypothetical protein [Novosphingobium sp. SG751A]NOW44083.1 molybdopterin-biosynthesis enzyme MoeA-like protein [Novosphingobium sp. SG751A]